MRPRQELPATMRRSGRTPAGTRWHVSATWRYSATYTIFIRLFSLFLKHKKERVSENVMVQNFRYQHKCHHKLGKCDVLLNILGRAPLNTITQKFPVTHIFVGFGQLPVTHAHYVTVQTAHPSLLDRWEGSQKHNSYLI